jgi:hypothetical protein
LGEFWGVYAELRREMVWGNLKLGIFGVLAVGPRGPYEEGGHLCSLCVFWGNLSVNGIRFCETLWKYSPCSMNGVTYLT